MNVATTSSSIPYVAAVQPRPQFLMLLQPHPLLLMLLQPHPLLLMLLQPSVADPDPKDLHHFAGPGSGSIIFSMDPDLDPDLNLAHHHSPPSSHLIFHT